MSSSTISRGVCTINNVPLYGNKSSYDVGFATWQNTWSATADIDNNTTQIMKDVSDLPEGCYIIETIIVFPAGNSTGYRRGGIKYYGANGEEWYVHTSVKASDSARTTHVWTTFAISIFSPYLTVSLFARQNSGAKLTGVSGYLYAHRLY